MPPRWHPPGALRRTDPAICLKWYGMLPATALRTNGSRAEAREGRAAGLHPRNLVAPGIDMHKDAAWEVSNTEDP